MLTENDMLLIVKKGITGGICYAIHRYIEANNKHLKNYEKHKESSFTEYVDAKNFYGYEMSQKLPGKDLKWKKIY